VRFIENFAGTRLKEAGPSQPARVSGWNTLTPAGTPFESVKNRKEAEALAEKAKTKAVPVAAAETTEDGKTVLPLIVKADVTGSIEAIKHELTKITHENAALKLMNSGVGPVSDGDVKNAVAAGGVVIGFSVPVDAAARDLADRSGVIVETFTIIYDLGKRVAELLAERAPHVEKEEVLGEAKILKVFSETSNKSVVGAKHVSGTLTVGGLVKILRREEEVGRGKILNLQQARADVNEIKVEGDFGMQIETKAEVAGGDIVTAFRVVAS
jgi:translation initiation factor IF-2